MRLLPLSLAAVALLALDTPATAQGRSALQAACFPPQALAPKPGENIVKRHVKNFDKEASSLTSPKREDVPAALRGAIRSVKLPKGDKSIALTFDLCEQRGEIAGYDGAIFKTLRDEAVKATLFAGGKWMRSHRDRTEQLMSDPLFEIANHSETHRNLRLLKPADAAHEILAPEQAFETARAGLAERQCARQQPASLDAVQSHLRYFRFPFGACNPASMTAVNDAGFVAIQWSLSTGDPDPHASADAIAAAARNVKPGDIVIMHANGRGWNTAKALPKFIATLKARGFTFVTVTELLGKGTPVVAPTCYNNRPGDTDRYDFPMRLAARKVHKPAGATAATAATAAAWKTKVSATPARRAHKSTKATTP